MGLFTGMQRRRLENKLQADPENPEHYTRLADLLRKQGDLDGAVAVLGRGLLRPVPPAAAQGLLSLLDNWVRMVGVDIEAAAKRLGESLSKAELPHAAELLARLESLMVRQFALDPDRANDHRRRQLEFAAEAMAFSQRPWVRLLLAQAELGSLSSGPEIDIAASALSGLEPMGQDPIFDGDLLLAIGDLERLSGRVAEASAAYERASRTYQDPLGLAESRIRLGRALQKKGDPSRAIEQFSSALNYLGNRPEVAWIHAELARLYASRNRVDDARREISTALSSPYLGPREKVDLSLLEAEILHTQHQLDASISATRRSVELADKPHQRRKAHRFLAHLLTLKDGGLEEAIELYRAMLEAVVPDDERQVRIGLGRALILKNDYKAAIEVFEPLERDRPVPGMSVPDIHLLVAEAQFGSGCPRRGLEILEELKRTDPAAEEVVEERARKFRRDLDAGRVEGLISPDVRKDLEESLSRLVGKAALLERLRLRLARSRESLVGRLERLVSGGRAVDEDLLDDVEELLITADVGVQTTFGMMEPLRRKVARGRIENSQALFQELKGLMLGILRGSAASLKLRPQGPTFILVVGVNGAGKTTTIAKLAHRFKEEEKKVLLVAGDTFRAGAIEQLQIWADRVGVPLIRQAAGSDPGAVVFDGAKAALSRRVDVVIVDTAGRLQTKVNLMEELKKLARILGRQAEGAPHEVLLVLDGTTGQNALSQAKLFSEAVPVTGIVLTKLDGSSKGGTILSIAHQMGLPIKLIGIGERMTDLRDFDPDLFVDALFGEPNRQSSDAP